MKKIFDGSSFYTKEFEKEIVENLLEREVPITPANIDNEREDMVYQAYNVFFNILNKLDFKQTLFVYCDLGFWNGRCHGHILSEDNKMLIKHLRNSMGNQDFASENISIVFLEDERLFKITLPHHDNTHYLYLGYLNKKETKNIDISIDPKAVLKGFPKSLTLEIDKLIENERI